MTSSIEKALKHVLLVFWKGYLMRNLIFLRVKHFLKISRTWIGFNKYNIYYSVRYLNYCLALSPLPEMKICSILANVSWKIELFLIVSYFTWKLEFASNVFWMIVVQELFLILVINQKQPSRATSFFKDRVFCKKLLQKV